MKCHVADSFQRINVVFAFGEVGVFVGIVVQVNGLACDLHNLITFFPRTHISFSRFYW